MNKRLRALHKIFSVISGLSLIFNAILPASLISLITAPPAYAEEATATPTVEPTPTIEPTQAVSPTPTEIPTPTQEVTPTLTPTIITPTPTEITQPTETGPPPTPTPEQGQILDGASTTATQSSSPWTFENVELNKEYQNGGVTLTFTKLPDPSGNIKIEEITLTQEQIQQTGSLSDKAYDITSDMKDGEFTYNLSLPIPEASKGKAVEVKFAEELSNIASAEKVENNLTKTDSSVSVTSLDHFTIFFVVVLQPSYATPGGGGVYSAYYGPPDYDSPVSPGTITVYDGREAGIIKAGITADPISGNYEDQGLLAFKPGDTTIETFSTQPLTYDFVNQYGTRPVWVYIELNKGAAGDVMYQYVPTTNSLNWHTEDAGTGTHWQKWTDLFSGNPYGSDGFAFGYRN
ncbi:MAG: hypothetical protein NTY06_01420 [Candidatus Gottesmanbacteria bacterium]|nr:hypothetical protein [Candidatus Gottesmanbacteria bacterium]